MKYVVHCNNKNKYYFRMEYPFSDDPSWSRFGCEESLISNWLMKTAEEKILLTFPVRIAPIIEND